MVKNLYPSIGSVSHGTMRPEDLIPAFVRELDHLAKMYKRNGDTSAIEAIDKVINGLTFSTLADYADDDEHAAYWDSEDAGYDLEALFDELDRHAAPYCTFGAHEGDGADYGYWVCWESLEEDCQSGDVLKIDAGDEWPEDEIRERVEANCLSYILEVNDHGNATLYDVNHNEIWSVV